MKGHLWYKKMRTMNKHLILFFIYSHVWMIQVIMRFIYSCVWMIQVIKRESRMIAKEMKSDLCFNKIVDLAFRLNAFPTRW